MTSTRLDTIIAFLHAEFRNKLIYVQHIYYETHKLLQIRGKCIVTDM